MPPSKIEAFAEANKGRYVIYKTDENYRGTIVGWYHGNILIYRDVGLLEKVNLIDHTLHIYDIGHLFITENDYEKYTEHIYAWSPSSFYVVNNKKEIIELIKKLEL